MVKIDGRGVREVPGARAVHGERDVLLVLGAVDVAREFTSLRDADLSAPVAVLLGTDGMLPGFDEAIVGAAKDEARTFVFTPDQGEHAGQGIDVNVIVRAVRERQNVLIAGATSSGKTTLARKLAERFPVNLLLEKAESNPFLSRFYEDPERYALPTQLFFLFQRSNQIRDIHQRDIFGDAIIADFFLEKDPLFARMNLKDDEFELYGQIYQQMQVKATKPDLVIYLQTPVETLLERVEHRNISYEQDIPREYLTRLSDAYSEFFHAYDSSPLLIVNNEKINVLKSEEAVDLLINRIMQVQSRREFFNPIWD